MYDLWIVILVPRYQFGSFWCLFLMCLIILWDFQCKAFRHTMYRMLGGSFEMWNIHLLGRELTH